MRTLSREMMSHIFIENIFMSPFPRFQIPKMSRFCRNNIDYSSIVDGEYLSSLHPTPVSSWLDFRYKEKKKSDKGNDGKRKTIDFTLLVFCFTVYYYCAKKFNQLSRNYRHLDAGEFYFGFYHVQLVQFPTSSTSCVRFEFQSSYFSQYSFYALKNTRKQMTENIANTRQFLSLAPIFKLRHLMDRNLTQLIHLIQTNIDNNKNSNNDSNSNIILSLQYLIIERVFQSDGECIVIRFSTLIDRKEPKKLFSKHESIIDSVLIQKEYDDKNSIDNKENNTNDDIENNNNFYDVSIGICNDNRNKKCIDYELILVSKLLKRSNNDDDNNDVNFPIIQVLSPNRNRKKERDNHKTNDNDNTKHITHSDSYYSCHDIDSDNKKENIGKDNEIDDDMNDSMSSLLLLLKRINKRKEFVPNCINVIELHENKVDNSTNVEMLLLSKHINDYNKFNLKEDSKHIEPNLFINDSNVKHNIIKYVTTSILMKLLINKRNRQEDKERNTISVSLIDGECVLILLSKLDEAKISIYNNNEENCSTIFVSKYTDFDSKEENSIDCTVRNEDDCNNCNVLSLYRVCFLIVTCDKSIIDTSALILSSKLLTHNNDDDDDDDDDNDDDDNDDDDVSVSIFIPLSDHMYTDRDEKRNDCNVLNLYVECHLHDTSNDNKKCTSVLILASTRIFTQDKRNNEISNTDNVNSNRLNANKEETLTNPINERQEEEVEEEDKQNVISVSLIDGECILIILLSKLSKRTISNIDKHSVMNTIDSVSIQDERDDESNSNDNASLFQPQEPSKRDDDMNDNTSKRKHTSVLINLLSELLKCYDNDIDYVLILLSKLSTRINCNCNVYNASIDNDNDDYSVLIREERDDEKTNSNDGSVLAIQLLSNRIDRNKKKNSIGIIGQSEANASINADNNKENNNDNTVSVTISGNGDNDKRNDIYSTNLPNSMEYIINPIIRVPFDSSNSVYLRQNNINTILIPLSKLSIRNHNIERKYSKYNDDNDVRVIIIHVQPSNRNEKEQRDGKCVIILLSKLSNSKEERSNENIIDNNKDRSTMNTNPNDEFDINININNNNLNVNDKYDCENKNETTAKIMMTTTNCNTTIKLSDGNSIGTSQLGLFMGTVCTQLFCLALVMGGNSVLSTCIQEYAYDIILKALYVFNCSILYWIFTIDGEYEILQRVRILVNDIRLELYLSSSKQQQAAKRGEMSQILHVM